MSISAGVGTSLHKNSKRAAIQAWEMALNNLSDSKADFIIVYANIGYDHDLLIKTINELSNNTPLVGCSSEGVISKGVANESNFGLTLLVISSKNIKFTPYLFEHINNRDEKIGEKIGKEVSSLRNEKNDALFLFPDGINCNFDSLKRGIEKQIDLNKFLPLLGGLAADNFSMKQTYQYCNDKVISNGISAFYIQGDINIAWGVNHGCTPIGKKRTVTKAKGNVIYEIDNTPILEVLKEYLLDEEIDDWSRAVINLCLAFKAPKSIENEYDEYLIRFMPKKDDIEGSITIPTEVKSGTDVWMSRRDVDKIESGVNTIIKKIKSEVGDKKLQLVFQFDCGGRGKMVMSNQRKEQINNILHDELIKETPWVGWYTFGEIAPLNNHNSFHNYTAVIIALY